MSIARPLIRASAVVALLLPGIQVFAAPTSNPTPPEQQAPKQAEQPTSPATPAPMFDPRTINEEIVATRAVLGLREQQLKTMAADQVAAAQKAADELKKLDDFWRREFDGWCAGRPACGLEPKNAGATTNSDSNTK